MKEGTVLAVRQDGRAHLRTKVAAYEWDEVGVLGGEDVSSARLPPVDIQGDFSMELTVLSNDRWDDKSRSLAITLRGADNQTLIFRCFEDQAGFIATLPHAEDSKPFTLAGRTPYKLRLERQDGTYRVLSNSKILLTPADDDHRAFHVCELTLSPKVHIGSIKIVPLAEATGEKPAAVTPGVKSIPKSNVRKVP